MKIKVHTKMIVVKDGGCLVAIPWKSTILCAYSPFALGSMLKRNFPKLKPEDIAFVKGTTRVERAAVISVLKNYPHIIVRARFLGRRSLSPLLISAGVNPLK